MNNEIILKPSLARFIFWFILFAILSTLSILILLFDSRLDRKVMLGGIFALFSLALLWGLAKICPTKTILIIKQEGLIPVYLTKNKQNLITWDQVDFISKFSQKPFPFNKGMFLMGLLGQHTDYLAIYLKRAEPGTDNKWKDEYKTSYGAGRLYELVSRAIKGQKNDLYIPSNYFSIKIDKILEILRQFTDKVR